MIKELLNIKKRLILFRSSRIEGWLMKGEPENIYNLSQQYIKKGGLAAEVGSWKGKSTYIIASVCKEKDAKILSIDTFAGVVNSKDKANEEVYREAVNDSEAFFNENIKKNLSGLPVEYLKTTSSKASEKISDRSLDFCFLDGDHTMPIVYEDIINYLPKVKKGGVLLGHDYSDEKNPNNQVKYAVDKIIGRKKIQIYQSLWIYLP